MDFNKGDTIVKEGDFGDAFYIIEEGEAVCTKTIDGASKVVSDPLGPGKYFGTFRSPSLSIYARST